MLSISRYRQAAATIGFLCALSLQAANYYVDPNGDDRGSGDKSAPFKTLGAAASRVEAGDSIIVASGKYTCPNTITLGAKGTADKKIYLIGALDSRPTLDFSSMPLASGNQGLILSGKQWFIKGLIIKGAGDNGLLIQGGSDNSVEFCDFMENQDTGCQLKGGAANNRVVNCDSYNNRDPDEGDADGFAPKMDVGSGNIFIGCRAWNNSDDGWDGYLRGADNVTTRLENCWCFKNGYRKDGSASTGNGNGFKMGGSDNKDLKHNFTLIRCLAFQNRVKGFDQNNNRGAMTLYNCTAFSNGSNYSISGSTSTLTVKNSIAAGSGSSSLSGGSQAANNLSVANSNFQSIDPSAASGPRKADGSLPDIDFMHLASGSDLIDAGSAVDGVTFNGTTPDLGCFETGISTPIAPPLIRGKSANLSNNRTFNPPTFFSVTIDGRKQTLHPHNGLHAIMPGVYIQSINNHTQRAVITH